MDTYLGDSEQRFTVEYLKRNPFPTDRLASIEIIDGKWLQCETSKERLGQNIVLRKIPFTPMVKKVLPYIDFEKAKNTNLNTISTRMKRLLPNHHPHELRHTFISRCKEAGVTSEVVSIWAGHSLSGTITSTVYTHYSEEFQLKEAEKVVYWQKFPQTNFLKKQNKTKKPAYAGKTGWKAGRKTKFNPKNFPISFPNLGKRKTSHIKQKTYIVFDLLNLIQYMVSVAGVAGFARNGIAIVRRRRNRVSNEWRSQRHSKNSKNG